MEARVVKEYLSRAEDGLHLREGDLVTVLDRHDTGWWLGRCNGRQGLFPCSRVELLDGGGAQPRQRCCVALYDFAAQEQDELAFKAGDTITLVSKSKSGWWKGRIGLREGIFPANRVREEGGAPGEAAKHAVCAHAWAGRGARAEEVVKTANPSRTVHNNNNGNNSNKSPDKAPLVMVAAKGRGDKTPVRGVARCLLARCC